jgi:hypothetical protein
MQGMKKTLKCAVAIWVMVIACMATKVTAEAAVSNLRQTDADSSTIVAEWSGSYAVYGVQLATDASFSNPKEGAVTTQGVEISNLNPGSTYYIRIGGGSTKDDCYANWSSPLQVVTAPAAVTNIRFIDADDKKATIEYSPSVGADIYRVYNVKNRQLGSEVANTTGTKCSFTVDKNLINQHIVVAEKKSASGFTARSQINDVYVNLLGKKISTKNFGVDANTAGTKLTMAAKYSGSGVEIELTNVGGSKYKKTYKSTKGFNAAASSVTKTVKANKFYKYRVRPYVQTDNGVKNGKWSDYKAFALPKTTKATMRSGSRKVNLKWSKLNGTGRIKIQVSTKKNSGYKTVSTIKKASVTKAAVTKYGKTKFKKGKTYYIRLVPEAKIGKKYVASSDVYKYWKVKMN